MGQGSRNQLRIALAAPIRWAVDHPIRWARDVPRRWKPRPPAAGVREPRRPKPTLPAAAIALAEPRTQTRRWIKLGNRRDIDQP